MKYLGVAAVLASCAVALLTSCASTTTSSHQHAGVASPRSAAALLDGCAAAGPGSLSASLPDEKLPLAVLGAGAVTVVLSEESDENLCSWLPFAHHLAATGFRVVLWDFASDDPVTELLAVVATARAAAGEPVILAGASEGAKASLIAATRLHPAPLAILSLSAETALRANLVAPAVHHLLCPALLITAADDIYGSAGAAHDFVATAPAGRVSLLTVPGSAHGTALLSGSGSAAVRARIDSFLARFRHRSGR